MVSSVFQSGRIESGNCSGINEIKYTKFETTDEKKKDLFSIIEIICKYLSALSGNAIFFTFQP